MPTRIQAPGGFRDIVAADWIRAVRKALKLSQGKFGEQVGAEGLRDTVAKWERTTKEAREPGFTYTRRILLIAPPAERRQFLGASAEASGLDGTDPGGYHRPPGGAVEDTAEARLIATLLNEMDKVTRARAYGLCVAAVEEARNPQELDADRRPGRAQRK